MKCVCFAAFLFAVSVCGYPTCGNGQIKVDSLKDCSVGDVDFTDWSFSASDYKGNAMVKMVGTANYDIDPEVITLKFSDPLQAGTFTLSFVATLTNGYEFKDVKQQLFTNKVPTVATATGTYNALSLTTDGLTTTAVSAGGELDALSENVNVSLAGTVLQPACKPHGRCEGGSVQSVEISLFQTAHPPNVATPEPITMALVGSGLLGLAALRRRRP